MSEDKTYEVKQSRIRKLARQCPDYEKAMRILFPEALAGGNETVTAEIGVYLKHTDEGEACITLEHNGEDIGIIRNSGVRLNGGYTLDQSYLDSHSYYFKIIKNAGK
jgi:hypothetical protein